MPEIMEPFKFDIIMDLSDKKCVPCEGGVPPLNGKEIGDLKKKVSADWKVVENSKIHRDFLFVNYQHTMDFVNRVAAVAEEQGHHPVMHVYYARVDVELWTHAINGLSENDFIMAAKIDKL
jgi:4a-hydroxytetrahydrobiopterin dehydratase